MNISNATVASKQNFIQQYYRLMKNLYNQNCLWKNEGNINRVSEISKTHSLHGFSQQWIFHLSNKIFRKHLKVSIIQPISVTFASVQFEKLHHKGIRLNNVCIQWVFAISTFHKIRQNITVYVNCKRIIQKFWSILNLLHLLTSYLFNKCSWRF